MTKLLSYLVFALTAAFAIAPAVTDPFSGFRPDQLPIPQIDPPIQPAGYAFSIWGLIYGWLIVSALFGVIKRSEDSSWDRARVPLSVSLAIGVPWLAIANASAIWATVTIALMAVFAIIALVRSPAVDLWWLRAPISIYAGWLTAATWVSLGSTAAGYGIAFGQIGWAVCGIIGAFVVASSVFWTRPTPGYLLTVVWALIGIIVANGFAIPLISGLAMAGVVSLLAIFALQMRGTATR